MFSFFFFFTLSRDWIITWTVFYSCMSCSENSSIGKAGKLIQVCSRYWNKHTINNQFVSYEICLKARKKLLGKSPVMIMPNSKSFWSWRKDFVAVITFCLVLPFIKISPHHRWELLWLSCKLLNNMPLSSWILAQIKKYGF